MVPELTTSLYHILSIFVCSPSLSLPSPQLPPFIYIREEYLCCGGLACVKLPRDTNLIPQEESTFCLLLDKHIFGTFLLFSSCGKFRFNARWTRLVGVVSVVDGVVKDILSTSVSSSTNVGEESSSATSGGLPSRCFMYRFCLPTLDPPPITRKTSPLGPCTTLSYKSVSSLSNLAGESFTLNLGEERSSSRSTSNLLSNSAVNRCCKGFGRTLELDIS